MAEQKKQELPKVFAEYLSIRKTIEEKKIAPLYIFYGEEAFFIDQLIALLRNSVLPPEQQAFNQSEFVAENSKEGLSDIFKALAREPRGGAEYNIVLVREADAIKDWEYFLQLLTTIREHQCVALQFTKLPASKNTDFKKILDFAQTSGVLYNSLPLAEREVDKVIEHIASLYAHKIERAAVLRFKALFGTGLMFVDNEIRKLVSALPEKQKTIEEKDLEHILPNREYAIYTLTDAIARNDYASALTIVYYMAANKKDCSISLNSSLYNYFKRIFIWGVLQKKMGNTELMAHMKIQKWQIQGYKNAAEKFSPERCARIISKLRQFDLKLKGVNSANTGTPYEEMKQLIVLILTA